MRYIKVDPIHGPLPGYELDADDYLRVLPEIESELPEGARRFALDGDHYNFFSVRCIKDLTLLSASISDSADNISVNLVFAPNKFKHDQGLVIQYLNVVKLAVEVTAPSRSVNVRSDSRRLGDLQLDEILPCEHGVSHEIKLTGGLIHIIASDMDAEWCDDFMGATDIGR